MGRPPLPIGAHGVIAPPKQLPSGAWEARTRYRDPDGVLRPVKRQGRSATAARNILLAALAERRHTAGSTLDGSSKVCAAAELVRAQWAAKLAAGEMSPRTVEAYESALKLHVLPALGEVRLREATTARCEAWLVELRKRKGASTSRRARSVLSAVLGYAARMGAIAANPVGDLSPIPGKRKRKPRAMTAGERSEWLGWLDTHVAHDPNPRTPRRPELDHNLEAVIASRALGDVTRFMLGTGVRIGESLAVSWDEVDFDAATVAICWHLVRVKGQGIVRLEGAKSEAGDRVLRIPSWCRDMLMQRRFDGAGYPVFPDTLGGWRDPNLVMRWIRWSRGEAGFDWLTSHVWRQTVITVLDEAGLSTREVADQAGHARIAQTQSYMARRVASDAAADALEGML